MKKGKAIKIIIGLIIITLMILIGYLVFGREQEKEIAFNNDVTISQNLYQKYKKGEITTDEYVRYMIYAAYEPSLLKEEYRNFKSDEISDLEYYVEKYCDELSEETLRYYFKKINLDNVTFELDKENVSVNVDSSVKNFVDEVYAEEEKVTNLNKVVLSSNGNFVVWYTTTGESATDYETAKKVADGLEETVEQYKELTGYDYTFNLQIASKGRIYKEQKKVLEKHNIDTDYLESAMQVYLIELGDGLAHYTGFSSGENYKKNLLTLLIKLSEDAAESITFPYIVIKPSSFSDYERLEQLYNHELFHHYQKQILCGDSICKSIEDLYISESTCNWASAMVSDKKTDYGFLNDWAAAYRYFSNDLLSEEVLEKNGEELMSYALFVYLYNYSIYVDNASEYIIKSIYEDESFKYLQQKADSADLIEIQKNIAIKNFTQDYENKNLNADPNYGYGITILDTVIDEEGVYFKDVEIERIAIDYYHIQNNSDKAYKIKLERPDKYISIHIIAEKDGEYSIVASSEYSGNEQVFDTNELGEYDSLYIAVTNNAFSDIEYSLAINEIEKKEIENQETITDYISVIDACAIHTEEVEEVIYTFYFNQDGSVARKVETVFLNDSAIIEDWYEYHKTNTKYKKIVANTEKRTVTYEWTEEAIQKYFSMENKSNIVKLYGCEGIDPVVDFVPDFTSKIDAPTTNITTSNDHISYIIPPDDEDAEKAITTFYFGEDEKVTRMVVTIFLKEGVDIDSFYADEESCKKSVVNEEKRTLTCEISEQGVQSFQAYDKNGIIQMFSSEGFESVADFEPDID